MHRFIMRLTSLMILSPLLCGLSVAASYRLFSDALLDAGNRWEYQLHTTENSDYGGPVDWWGTGVREVTGTQAVAGYNTTIMTQSSSIDVLGDSVTTYNYILNSQHLLEIRRQDADMKMTVRNGNPIEKMPIWVNETDEAGHFGYGLYTGRFFDSSFTWNGSMDCFITYLGQETVTVPAGTFDCVVVMIREETYYFDGIWEYWNNKHWFNPVIGSVKSEEDGGFWNSYEAEWSYGTGTSELTWTNLTRPGDLNADDKVNLADFSAFSGVWLKTESDPDWNRFYDIDEDGIINEMDLQLLCENWLTNE